MILQDFSRFFSIPRYLLDCFLIIPFFYWRSALCFTTRAFLHSQSSLRALVTAIALIVFFLRSWHRCRVVGGLEFLWLPRSLVSGLSSSSPQNLLSLFYFRPIFPISISNSLECLKREDSSTMMLWTAHPCLWVFSLWVLIRMPWNNFSRSWQINVEMIVLECRPSLCKLINLTINSFLLFHFSYSESRVC